MAPPGQVNDSAQNFSLLNYFHDDYPLMINRQFGNTVYKDLIYLKVYTLTFMGNRRYHFIILLLVAILFSISIPNVFAAGAI